MGMQTALLEAVASRIISSSKITIVGPGVVGMACAFSILTQNVSNNIALVGTSKDQLLGEKLDLQHGSQFLRNARIKASTEYDITAGSRICIVTAGSPPKPGGSRIDSVESSVEMYKVIIPQLITHSPDTILLIVTNPVDIMTYAAHQISGIPKHRVIGSGTNLDSARLRFFMCQKLGVAPSSCHGWVIGEHGDSSVIVWSSLNVAGVNLRSLNPKLGIEADPENWSELHKKVIECGFEVVRLKQHTSWAIALSVTDLVRVILNNTASVRTVSVHVKGFHGIKQDVCLSLPAILGASGVSDIVKQQLSSQERAALHKSAEIIYNVQSKLPLK